MINLNSMVGTIDALQKNEKEVKSFGHALDLAFNLNRQLFITGEIDMSIGESVDSAIRFWNMYDDEQNVPVKDRQPIKIYIDSPGGELNAGFMVVDAISLSKTPVWVINIGMAYSTAFLIFIAGHKRFCYPGSSFLLHEGGVSLGGYEDAHKFANYATFYKKQLEKLKAAVIKYTKITEDEYNESKKDDVWYLSNEAYEKGICDEIIEEFV